MLSEHAIIREAASRIAEAATATVSDLREGLIEHEPNFTDRMLGRIADAMDGYRSKGLTWRAKTLTDCVPNSQESRFGADFVATLSINLPDYVVHKGFLGQAKLFGRRPFGAKDQDRLASQCHKMLALSPASFVFVYSKQAIRVVPAVAVTAAGRIDERANYSRSIKRFYEEHFACFIGDSDVNAPSAATLLALLERYEARSGLWLGTEPEGESRSLLGDSIGQLRNI